MYARYAVTGTTWREGSLRQNLPPGTAFADLPDDWQCPVCFASKTEFVKES